MSLSCQEHSLGVGDPGPDSVAGGTDPAVAIVRPIAPSSYENLMLGIGDNDARRKGFNKLPEDLQVLVLEMLSPLQILALFDRARSDKSFWLAFQGLFKLEKYENFWKKKLLKDFNVDVSRIIPKRSSDASMVEQAQKEAGSSNPESKHPYMYMPWLVRIYLILAQRAPSDEMWDCSSLENNALRFQPFDSVSEETFLRKLRIQATLLRLPRDFKPAPDHFYLSKLTGEWLNRVVQLAVWGVSSAWFEASWRRMKSSWMHCDPARVSKVTIYGSAQKTGLFFSDSVEAAEHCLLLAESVQDIFDPFDLPALCEDSSIFQWVLDFKAQEGAMDRAKTCGWMLESLGFHNQADLAAALYCLEKAEPLKDLFGAGVINHVTPDMPMLTWILDFKAQEGAMDRAKACGWILEGLAFHNHADLAAALCCLEKAEPLKDLFFGSGVINQVTPDMPMLTWILDFKAENGAMGRAKTCGSILRNLDFHNQPDLAAALCCLEKAEPLKDLFLSGLAPYLDGLFFKNVPILTWILDFKAQEGAMDRAKACGWILGALGFHKQADLDAALCCLEKAEALRELVGSAAIKDIAPNVPILTWILDVKAENGAMDRAKACGWILGALGFHKQADLAAALRCLEKAEALRDLVGAAVINDIAPNVPILTWILDFKAENGAMDRAKACARTLQSLDFQEQADLDAALRCLQKAEALNDLFGVEFLRYRHDFFSKDSPILTWILDFKAENGAMDRAKACKPPLLALNFLEQHSLNAALECLEKAECFSKLFAGCFSDCWPLGFDSNQWIIPFKRQHPELFEKVSLLPKENCCAFLQARSMAEGVKLARQAIDPRHLSLACCSFMTVSIPLIAILSPGLKYSVLASFIALAIVLVVYHVLKAAERPYKHC